jgi:hypothetical protein
LAGRKNSFLESTLKTKLIAVLTAILMLACGVFYPQSTPEPAEQNPVAVQATATPDVMVINTAAVTPTQPLVQTVLSIVGTWNSTYQWLDPPLEEFSGTLTFNPDGTGVYTNEKTSGNFTWIFDNGQLTWAIVGSDATYIATLMGERLQGTMSGTIGEGPEVASGVWSAYR